MPLNLNIPQYQFYSMDKPFRAFVAGYRGGKTFLGCVRLCILALEYPGVELGYFAPTYPQIRDIFYTTISDVAEIMGMTVEIKTSNNEVFLYYHGDLHAMVKCRSMEHPQRIVGFQINHALVDEIDCMKRDKADAAWKKIVARLSSKGFDEQRIYDEEMNCDLIIEALGENTVDFTTTPEGFNWIYDFFVKQLRDDESLKQFYGIVNASTRQNAKNLPPDYIDKLLATYPPNLAEAYIDGQFTNLLGGTIYNQYTDANPSFETIQESDKVLYIGMDFNVTKMAARVFVYRDRKPHCVDEFNELYDTTDMIENIEMRYPDKRITVYPDASGKNRKTNAADETDISLLKAAGFRVLANDANPRVKTRINSVNAMFCNAKGEHNCFVNRDTCPVTHEELEQQVYNDKGEPDKQGGKDHGNDAFGYFIDYEHGINKQIDRLF